MPSLSQTDMEDDGSKPQHTSFAQQIVNPVGVHPYVYGFASENCDLAQKRDVGEAKIDHDVHEFSYWNTDALPYIKRDSNYDPNGSSPRAHQSTLLQQDINPTGMHPWVYEFSSANSDYLSKGTNDISDKQIDEEVHGFSSDNVDPVAHRRPEHPPTSFSQQIIGTEGIDDNVHAFSSNNVDLIQNKQIINDEQMDEEVHGFTNHYNNLAQNTYWSQNRKGVRSDVYDVVERTMNPDLE